MSSLLPIFPLPDMVLFPRTHLPLHVFEERYRALVSDVVGSGSLIGIAQLREGYQEDYHGSPPVFRILTAARLLISDRLEDGRWNVIVEGVERVELVKEVTREPFRVAEVLRLVDEVEEERRAETMAEMRAVAELAGNLGRHIGGHSKRHLANMVDKWRHPGVVADVAAAVLVTDPYARRGILEERCLLRRLKLVSVQLHVLAGQLREKGIEVIQPAGE